MDQLPYRSLRQTHGARHLSPTHAVQRATDDRLPLSLGQPGKLRQGIQRERPLRHQILERDQHSCQWIDDAGICGARAGDVDHIIPRAAGGTDDPANLQALCRRHHRIKTGRDARALRH